MEKKQQTAFEIYLEIFRSELPLGESFDLLERKLRIGGRRASVFFVDGLHDSEKSLMLFKYLLAVPEEAMAGITASQEFLERNLPFMEAEVIEAPNSAAASSAEEDRTPSAADDEAQSCKESAKDDGALSDTADGAAKSTLYDRCRAAYREALPKLYAGLIPLAVEGLDKLIIMDVRQYPARAVEEPEKEKTLRGAKDGFTETLMSNIGLIRRRIRDNSLIFKAYNIGSISKSDVALAYMKDRTDKKLVRKMEKVLEEWTRQERAQQKRSATGSALTVSDQSLLEKLLRAFDAGSGINPFPKVRYSQRPDVGAVGAKLYYPDDTIQHAGVIMGINGSAGHSHKSYPRKAVGDLYRLVTTQDYMAVTGACLMTKTELYRAAGGLDEAKFAVAYNDVDYCLKLWQKGLLNVYTPRAEAYHYESKSRGLDTTPENAARYAREKANFYTKYHEYIDNYDPYYNPHFNNLFENFGLK